MSEFENKNDIINIINENTEYKKFKEESQLNDNEIITELIANALIDDNNNVTLTTENINGQIGPYIRFLNNQQPDYINDFVTLLSDNKENIHAYSKVLQTQSKAYSNVSENITVSDTPGSVGPGDKLVGRYADHRANQAHRAKKRKTLQQLNNGGKKRLRNATKKKRNLRKKKHTRRKKRKTRRN